MKAEEFVNSMREQKAGVVYFYQYRNFPLKIRVIRNEFKRSGNLKVSMFDIAFGPLLYENIEKFSLSPLTKYHLFASGEYEDGTDLLIATEDLQPWVDEDEEEEEYEKSEKDCMWERD